MPVRFYIVPNSRDFIPAPDDPNVGTWELRSKYFKDMVGLRPSRRPFGLEGFDLVACDVSSLDHGLISGNADVLSFPESLDASPGAGARNQTATALEARGIPAGWIQAGMTWRQILRIVYRIVTTVKNLNGGAELIGRLFEGGRTLATQFQDLPQGVRQRLIAYAQSKGWDTSGLSNASPLRQILKFLADQDTATPRMRGMDL